MVNIFKKSLQHSTIGNMHLQTLRFKVPRNVCHFAFVLSHYTSHSQCSQCSACDWMILEQYKSIWIWAWAVSQWSYPTLIPCSICRIGLVIGPEIVTIGISFVMQFISPFITSQYVPLATSYLNVHSIYSQLWIAMLLTWKCQNQNEAKMDVLTSRYDVDAMMSHWKMFMGSKPKINCSKQ